MARENQKKRTGRRIALAALGVGLACVLFHVVHAYTFDKTIEYKEVSLFSPDVPQEMDGYRIAFVSDTHSMPLEHLEQVVEEINNRQVDLLVLGGDFPSGSGALRQSMAILSKVEARDGVFGVEGNHDRPMSLFAAMEEYSITPLSNNGLYIREHFYLAGTKDLWSRSASIAEATDTTTTEDFVLLLSHNPDITMQQDTSGVDLILSGHTHGGQLTFLGLWAPLFTFDSSITDYGQRFRSGWALSRDGIPVYVSNGTGEYLPRVFSRPQVILITLHHEDI